MKSNQSLHIVHLPTESTSKILDEWLGFGILFVVLCESFCFLKTDGCIDTVDDRCTQNTLKIPKNTVISS